MRREPPEVDVQRARERSGLQQAHLADLLGIGRSQLAHWEAGRKSPNALGRWFFALLDRHPELVRRFIEGRGEPTDAPISGVVPAKEEDPMVSAIDEVQVVEAEDVYFRMWLPDRGRVSDSDYQGVLDLVRRGLDASEAIVCVDMYGHFVLAPRGMGKDIPSEWLPLIGQQLLLPVNTGRIQPVQEHVYGRGSLERVVDLRRRRTYHRLTDVQPIPPGSYQRAIYGREFERAEELVEPRDEPQEGEE